MAEKVYKVYMTRFKEAWYQLSSVEQNELTEKIQAKQRQLGVKLIVLCDASWSSEEWQGFGLEEFRDIDRVQEYTAFLNEINWFRYTESKTLLGTKWPGT